MQMPVNKFTQQQKILTLMCRKQEQQWWLPHDFMKPELGDLFVGYEASARLSELGSDYPDMVESKRHGKYMKRRIRFEDMDSWLNDLPKDLRYVVHRSGLTTGKKKMEFDKPKPTNTFMVAAVAKVTRDHIGIKAGQKYDLVMEHLVVGQPVKIVAGLSKPVVYQDLAEFNRDWQKAS